MKGEAVSYIARDHTGNVSVHEEPGNTHPDNERPGKSSDGVHDVPDKTIDDMNRGTVIMSMPARPY